MQLYALLENNAKTSLPDMEITGLTDDSRKVQPGMLFACIRGERFDGHTAAKDVLERGAAAVLADHDLGLGDRQILTLNISSARMPAMNTFSAAPRFPELTRNTKKPEDGAFSSCAAGSSGTVDFF